MNKVFKIIWSQVLKSWVVASELSKSKTKSKSSVANKTALITLSALTGLAGSAYAQQGVGGGQATGGSNGTAISACSGKQQAQAIGNHAIAIGCEAEANNNANSNNTTNIQLVNRHNPGNPQVGKEYLMVNAASTAIGYRAKALNASIAFGDNAQATNVGIAIGLGAESLNNSAIALGSLAQAKGNTSFALGRQSVAENDYATAIGNVAYAKSESSIAMGHSATAEGYRAIAIGAADSKNAPGDGVSRGAGYQVNSQTLAKGEDSIAFGGGANATQRDALAIGAFSKSSGAKAVAIGTGSNAGAAEAVAIGQGATALTEGGVALGRGAKVNEVGSIALGQNSATSVSNEQGYLTNTAAPKSIVSVGSTGNERRIQHVSAGAKDTDAVNVSQLKAVHNIASKGWNVTTQGTGSTNVAPGGTVDFSNTDGNIVVSKTNNNIQLNLDKKITADEITINNGGPVVNKKGINLNNTKIINLVEGVADGDAVNVKQLTNNINQVTNHLTAKGLNFSANNGGVVHRDLGTELAIKGEATTEGTFSGGNLKTVAKPDGSINIQMADAPKFGDITINNDGKISGVKDGVDGKDAVNVNQLTEVKEIANKGWNVTAQGVDSSNVKPGETVDFASTDGNIVVSKNGHNLSFDLAANLTGIETIETKEITSNKIIIKDGKPGENGQPGKDLDVGEELNKGLNFAGNTGEFNRQLGEVTTIKGEASTAGTFSGGNLKTVAKPDGSINIQMADAPKFGDITINNDGRITGVKDGVDGKDAVNVSQLTEVKEVANKGWNVTAQGGNSSNVKPGETVDFANADNNIVVSKNGHNLSFDLAKDLTGIETIVTKEITSDKIIIKDGKPGENGQPGKDLDVGEELNKGLNFAGNTGEFNRQLGEVTTIKGEASTAGTFSGGNLKTVAKPDGSINIQMADAPKFGDITINNDGRITGVKDGVDGKDAVNVSQLTEVKEVANKGWNVTAQGGNSSNVKPGEAVDFANADGNIVVSKNGHNLSFDLAKDLTGIETIVTKEITSDKIIIKDGKPGENGQPGKDLDVGEELNKGLNFAGNTGEFNRQLGEVTTIKGEASTAGTFSGGNLKTVAKPDGSINIQMADAPKFGDITINNDGRITGVKDGVDGKDAVNVSQLTEVKEVANKGWNVTAQGGNSSNVKPGETVDFASTDGNIVVSKNGHNLSFDLAANLTGIETIETKEITSNKIIIKDGKPGENGQPGKDLDVGEELNKGLNFAGNTGEFNRQLGEVTTIKGEASTEGTFSGGNLKTVAKPDGSINIQMADAPKFGDITINNDGRITGVKDGVDGKDAVNVSQLTEVKEVANKGWNVTAQGGNSSNVKPGETVDFASTDGNIVVSKNGHNLSFDLAANLTGIETIETKEITSNKIIIKDGKPGENGQPGKDLDVGEELNKGLNFAGNTGEFNRQLGEVTTIKGEASTEGTFSGGNLKTVAKPDGSINIQMADAPKFGDITINNDGRITGVKDGVDGKDAVNVSQLTEVKEVANKGWNVTAQGGNSSNVKPGEAVDFANADGNIVVSKNGHNLSFDLAANLTGIETIETKEITSNKIIIKDGKPGENGQPGKDLDVGEELNKGLNFAGNTGEFNRQLGEVTTIKGEATTAGTFSGSNLKTVANADGSINIQMADAPKFGDITINNDGRITGVADGKDGKDAVNMDQLGKVTEIANKGWNVTAQGGDSSNVKPGETVDFANGDNNIVVSKNGHNLSFDLAKDLTGIETIVTKEITSDKIIIKDGKPGENGQPGKDLDVGEELNKGLNFAGNTGEFNRQLGEVTTIKGEASTAGTFSGGNLKTVAKPDGSINIQMADAPKFGDITINNDGRITGVKDGVDGKDAVNMDQLGKVTEVANKGWNVTAQGGNSSNVKPGETVDFASTDGNIVVSKNGHNLSFDLAANLTGIETIETKEITSNKIIIKDGKPGENGQPGKDLDVGEELNKGLNFAGNTGEFNRQLGEVTTIKGEASTEGTFSGGNLKTVAKPDGSINIQMADAPKFGDITINNDGRITGVKDGVDGKDAVNVSQLTEVQEVANKGWQLQANGDAASKVAPGDTVQFIDGNNIKITRNGNDLTFSTADNVAFNKVDVAGGLNILGGGLSISGGNRIDLGNNVIHNIAKGVAGSDAVNVDQLNEEIGKIRWYVDGKAPNGGTGEIEVSPGTDGNGGNGGTGGTGSGNGGSQPGKPGGNTVTMEGKDNISVTVDGSNNTVTVGTAGKGSIAANSKDVITGGQVYDVAVAIAENTKNIIGGQTKVTQTRDGEIKHSVEFDMAGGKQTTINDAMKAIDNSAVHYDKTADGKVDKSKVTLGEKGTEVTVGNVAAGVKDNDAVNVSQLKGAVTKIDNQFIEVNNQIGDIHNNMGRMDQKINKIDKDSRAGVAAAMAAAGLPQAYLPGKSMMAIAGSTWRGETGYAIGVSTISDNGNWVVKANMSGNARSQYGASAGVGYQW